MSDERIREPLIHLPEESLLVEALLANEYMAARYSPDELTRRLQGFRRISLEYNSTKRRTWSDWCAYIYAHFSNIPGDFVPVPYSGAYQKGDQVLFDEEGGPYYTIDQYFLFEASSIHLIYYYNFFEMPGIYLSEKGMFLYKKKEFFISRKLSGLPKLES